MKRVDHSLNGIFMKPLNFLTSACRYCRFYQPEGRRGGVCLSLGVPVQGCWKACVLAKPPFAPTWGSLEGIMKWSNEPGVLPASQQLVSKLEPKLDKTALDFGLTAPKRGCSMGS
ncbi:MAG: hypothetical protein JO235_14770 [Chroococcidiopsidaceae cyanobacterium CP_BM_RX_35]|nr:hypothetical protein [Chroococcidiopsidaceae cyanobacterium CP_BM_RX_35]